MGAIAAKPPNYYLNIEYMDTYIWLYNNGSPQQIEEFNIAKDKFHAAKNLTNFNIAYELDLLGDYAKNQRQTRDKLKQEQAKRLGTLWLWLTINPKPEISFRDFQKSIEKVANRRMFQEYLYVYEQRSTTLNEAGKGFHAHLLLRRDIKYKQCKVISNLKNSFKNICDTNNHMIFNYHWLPEEYRADKKEYILGTKTEDGKDEKQIIDKLWRKLPEINILPYYITDEIEV
ncbi:MAG: putative replication initiation protein [Circular genetic element sp.]|nr:MAG: putative replication initiation protein [Circular genetic element sp.]